MVSEKTRTYWRLKLFTHLRDTRILRSMCFEDDRIVFDTIPWEAYWGEVPKVYKDILLRLKTKWEKYIYSGFSIGKSKSFSECYFLLLKSICENIDGNQLSDLPFVKRVLGFENFSLRNNHFDISFAAATTSFRNPLFLSFCLRGLRNNMRNDSLLLPLLYAIYKDEGHLYYHYRKQQVITKTEDCILFYPHVNMDIRKESFFYLEDMKKFYLSNWDSRVQERAEMMATKVLHPLLQADEEQTQDISLQILDVGSGDGKYTKTVISKIVTSGITATRKIEISLLDILDNDPGEKFGVASITPFLSKVEYFPCKISDIRTFLQTSERVFDFVFVFRLFHNLSSFAIDQTESNSKSERTDRYSIHPHMSSYYGMLQNIMPEVKRNIVPVSTDHIYHPVRQFNDKTLFSNDGSSIIDQLASKSKYIIIEDGDLTPNVMVHHIAKHVGRKLYVYDLSRLLGLTINHVFVIANHPLSPEPGLQIWPSL